MESQPQNTESRINPENFLSPMHIHNVLAILMLLFWLSQFQTLCLLVLSADKLCKQFVPRPVELNYLNSVLIDLVALDSHIESLFPIAIFTSRTGITLLLISFTFSYSHVLHNGHIFIVMNMHLCVLDIFLYFFMSH